MKLPESTLVKKQSKSFSKSADGMDMTVTIRHDDCCGNGHNSFAVTMDAYESGKPHTDRNMIMGGCCHDEVSKYFPELAHLIKWHLTSTVGPMHYLANTMYHASKISKHQGQQFVYLENKQLGIRRTLLGIFTDEQLPEIEKAHGSQFITTKEHFNGMAKEPELEYARSSAVWPDATLDQLLDETALMERLPALMVEFKSAVESIGLVY